jgi:hypothetical protein
LHSGLVIAISPSSDTALPAVRGRYNLYGFLAPLRTDTELKFLVREKQKGNMQLKESSLSLSELSIF